ncbi:BON domain-containing protein [Celerinatantimonas diazotrophica]|uniref:Osmotically-inducible protein OsmY n=1 Tax=Celerinatantimonas diazotrophica TaxID=412034 RepID=A0A4R1JA41_9GAMM|nr:BON domain-containing protein [Celerinatantimonas diazotrophica]TCK46969.1 osmotically-inducible protein OsmY [Celerinatantimonas diazotrophica]CAG9295737.1 Osmotically-inducible protein Y [Celerinatantimonas diazotrophica]
MKLTQIAAVMALTTVLAAPSVFAQSWQGKAKDAWLDGKVETAIALNQALNSFEINTDVSEGKVTLTGTVKTDAEKELAGEISKNVDGVQSVDNELAVQSDVSLSDKMNHAGKAFANKWNDLTTIAMIKAQFAASKSLSVTDIHVSANNGVVTLTGHVDSLAAKDLAESKAMHHDHVKKVVNKLRVD